MFKKLMLVLLVATFIATPALAGNRPEFDAVGNDSANFFNDFIKQSVVLNALDRAGNQINLFSAFPIESFTNTAGTSYPDPCFPGYFSSMVDQYNSAVYYWTIVLQMKPESDIDLNIVDCVLKHNTFNIWNAAEQTGRYRAPWGQFFFLPSANPAITVEVYPGPFATPGFTQKFVMDARPMPGLLNPVRLVDALYTSKALWEEGLVMVMPETGLLNTSGQTMYNLKQGDYFKIKVVVPDNNTADIFYGKDNVVLKYIGIVGTEYTTL
jgi:hypothetical protein